MKKYIDKFFSALPFAFILYHVIASTYSFNHIKVLAKISANYLLSMILKRLFVRQRRTKNFKFEEWSIPDKLTFLKTHYSFPSSHAMFYVKYLTLFPYKTVMFLCCVGTISRVYFQHHRIDEVLVAIGFVVIFEIIYLCIKFFY